MRKSVDRGNVNQQESPPRYCMTLNCGIKTLQIFVGYGTVGRVMGVTGNTDCVVFVTKPIELWSASNIWAQRKHRISQQRIDIG